MDARLGPDGDLLDETYRSLITGDELVRQRLVIRLQRHLGEWFLDDAVGLPFDQWIQQTQPDLGQIAARVRTTVATTPGVVSTTDFRATHAVESSLVRVQGTFVTADGTTDGVLAASTVAARSNASPWAILFRSGDLHGAPGGLQAFEGWTGG